ESAKCFEETHGIPYISTPFPIGALAGERFLEAVGNAVGIGSARVKSVIAEEKNVYYDYFERISDIYNDADLQRYAIVAADSNYAPALTRFVSDELGWLPELAVVTDVPDDEQQAAVRAQFTGLNSGLSPVVYFDSDTSSVKKYLRDIWEPNRNNRYY
ncbi:nitrogenase component 1, partial [Treponema endosymbiont of Eucomonympha sp.]|uniref:nitrogenase component 1 n=1 Tax=Treponema endosymbiont of Eucomonympha sp. TaxID=1580831 RepID=UPI000A7F1038